MRQDWGLVQAILDYRNAQSAIELFNSGAKGVGALKEHPALGELLVEMSRAQGQEMTQAGLLADMAQRREED